MNFDLRVCHEISSSTHNHTIFRSRKDALRQKIVNNHRIDGCPVVKSDTDMRNSSD